ncbi:MAG: NAD(P)H-dependent oxidoreductase [Elusimicrobia bacterium]|nr:NAD(P)H-dependent oxidoreductase [Elusimicrobiota bacterium]
MRNLIIYCHPNPKSFNHAILETVMMQLKAKGQEIVVRDLYGIGFSPVKQPADFIDLQNKRVADDIAVEQSHLLWAERVIVIYPVWWTGIPALLKGYFDRVLTLGFAYSYDFKDMPSFKLAGKEAYLFSTTGAPSLYYRITRVLSAMSKTSDGGIFKFCKMKVKNHAWFGSVPSTSEKNRAAYLQHTQRIVQAMR